MESTKEFLPCIEIDPKDKAEASVIWMHGLGASGHDFEPVVHMIKGQMPVPTRFVLPHAPSMSVTVNGGMQMPAWYDMLDMGHPRNIDWDTLKSSEAHIEALIQREIDAGIAAENIVIAGFSQGGAMAYRVALTYEKKLAGIIALSTYILKKEGEDIIKEANKNIPIFLGHGTMDPVIPSFLGEQARDELSEAGCEVEYKTYPMPHSVCEEEIIHIQTWLIKLLSK